MGQKQKTGGVGVGGRGLNRHLADNQSAELVESPSGNVHTPVNFWSLPMPSSTSWTSNC